MHPWRLCHSTPQTSQAVERRLHAEIDAGPAFIATHGLPAKQKAVDKVHKQLAGVSALVDVWWQSGWHDVQQVAMTPMWQRGGAEQLLPLMYWQHQVSRTRCPRRNAKLVQALAAVQDTFDRPPITRQLASDVLEGGKRGRRSMPRPFSVPRRLSKAATALWRPSITISGASRSSATRCGRCCITSIAAPPMGRRLQRGF